MLVINMKTTSITINNFIIFFRYFCLFLLSLVRQTSPALRIRMFVGLWRKALRRIEMSGIRRFKSCIKVQFHALIQYSRFILKHEKRPTTQYEEKQDAVGNFFFSRWFSVLSDLDGYDLLDRLQREVM